MEFTNEELEAKLTVPEEPTRRQLLRYDSQADIPNMGMYERLWGGVQALADEIELECDYVNIDDDLDTPAEDPRWMDVVKWASLAVFSWRRSVESAEKN